MKIMVVGGGGREHAIIKKLKESKLATGAEIFALPGNGGISFDATCVNIGAKEIDKIVEFAVQNSIDYAIVAPDDPLVLGAVDALSAKGIKAFGPTKAAAEIEGSKAFAKDLMKKYNIPTASYKVFDELGNALEYIEKTTFPTVIKADGLALGKGVIIAEDKRCAKEALLSIMQDKQFGESGNKVVIEEYLEGPEVSVLAFTDGTTVVPMVSSMDHKRACDGDTGLNTGGMGTIAPNPYYTEEVACECMEKIFLPTIRAMKSEGREFRGCLYFGLMLTKNGPRVIEYNCRFGDPETQVVLPLLKGDLLSIMLACTNGTLSEVDIGFSNECACCVIKASNGYPSSYKTGFEINIGDIQNAELFIAGAKREGERLYTSGGRVLGITAKAGTLSQAIDEAYEAVSKVTFENEFYRTDIGQKALIKSTFSK